MKVEESNDEEMQVEDEDQSSETQEIGPIEIVMEDLTNVFKATCIVEGPDVDLPTSPAYMCLGCFNLWPKLQPTEVHLPLKSSRRKKFSPAKKERLKNVVESYLNVQEGRKVKKQDEEKIDWTSIQMEKTLKCFSLEQLQREWHRHLHPDRRTGPWVDAEKKKLTSVVESTAPGDWSTIATKLNLAAFRNKIKVRTGFDCFSQYQCRHNREHRKVAGVRSEYFWSPEEIDKFNQIISEQRKSNGHVDWNAVKDLMPGTTTSQLRARYYRSIADPTVPKERPVKSKAVVIPTVRKSGRKNMGIPKRDQLISKLQLLNDIKIKRNRKLSLPEDGRKHGLTQPALDRLYNGQVDPDQVDLNGDATEDKKVLIEMTKEIPTSDPRPAECLPPTLHTLTGL